MLKMILSMSTNNAIGRGVNLCFRCKDDLQFFREKTMGETIIMGRKTFESIPNTLPGRKIVVISSKKIDNIECFDNIEGAISKHDNAFIIGGKTIFEQTINNVKQIFLTQFTEPCYGEDLIEMTKSFVNTLNSEFQKKELKSICENKAKIILYQRV